MGALIAIVAERRDDSRRGRDKPRNLGEGKLMKYDVVIVGGGAAGSLWASRLAADVHTSVLLLEAGPDYPDPAYLPEEIRFGHTRLAEAQESKHNWALRGTITEEQGQIHVAQGKVMGGGSSING